MWIVQQAGHDLEGCYFKRSEAGSGKLLCFGGSQRVGGDT